MPNIAHNILTVKNTGNKFENLKTIFKAINGDKPEPFNTLIPMPDEIRETEFIEGHVIFSKGYDGDLSICPDDLLSNLALQSPENRELRDKYLQDKYGATNWYVWAFKNWHTKWEALDVKFEYENDDEFRVEFKTAWGPPMAFFEAISEQFPDLTFALDLFSLEGGYMAAGGYAPDYPISIDSHVDYLDIKAAPEMVANKLPLSDSFIEFGRRFSEFPIKGNITREDGSEIEPNLNTNKSKNGNDAL